MTADSTWQYDSDIRSNPTVGIKLIDQFVARLEQFDWPAKEVFGIHMALEEAIINAIKHGNQESDEKSVRITVRLSPDEFYIKVTDEGVGFKPEDVPDPTLPENLERGCGRGLMLMRHYMDRVDYNDLGNSVEMSKARGAE